MSKREITIAHDPAIMEFMVTSHNGIAKSTWTQAEPCHTCGSVHHYTSEYNGGLDLCVECNNVRFLANTDGLSKPFGPEDLQHINQVMRQIHLLVSYPMGY